MKIWTEIVANDIHIPKQNDAAVNCFYKACDLIRPNGITLNGDIMDCGVFSRHDVNKAPKKYWTDSEFAQASDHDFEEMNTFLDRLDGTKATRKRYALGNHEVWLQEFIKRSPRTRKMFNLETQLSLSKRKWEVYPYNTVLSAGKLKIIHGLFTGQHHAAKTVLSMAGSVLYGHSHDIQVFSKHTLDEHTHMAWCNGCLSDMNPEYLKNCGQNWSHGFAIVYIFPNGRFQVDIIRIQDGQCIVQGQYIDGRK